MVIDSPPVRRRNLIGLTPLIDVVFILLVFFMLASSFLDWRSIALSLPGEGGEPSSDTPPLVVRIASDGVLTLDGENMELAELERRLSTLLGEDPARAVIIRPADDVSLQRIVQVVDRLSAAGGSNMTLNREGR
ncbi:MAG: biopolymer transporter ExbD [Ectothiorhodospiraceae bacterium]|nr:biopolymer transporter ExbD [Ectothiorhodospiraceae bacterium]